MPGGQKMEDGGDVNNGQRKASSSPPPPAREAHMEKADVLLPN